MRRAEAQRAYELWSSALTFEDRARLWVGEREGYERFTGTTFAPDAGVTAEPVTCDGVPALRVTPTGGSAGTGPVVLHLHGGGYTMGSAQGAVDLASRLAAAVGVTRRAGTPSQATGSAVTPASGANVVPVKRS